MTAHDPRWRDPQWHQEYRASVARGDVMTVAERQEYEDKRADERTGLFVSVCNRDLFERTIAMADAVCDLAADLSVEDWHGCLDDLAIILAEHRSGEASR